MTGPDEHSQIRTELHGVALTLTENTAMLRAMSETVNGLRDSMAAYVLKEVHDKELRAMKDEHKKDVDNIRDSHREATANLARDIKGLQDWQTWALRIVIGAVIMAVLGLVLVAK